MKVMHGNLLKLAQAGLFDVIIHGCNCKRTMGGGIALQIKRTFPAAYAADRATSETRDKLGTYTSANLAIDDRTLTVVNAYTQFDYGGSAMHVDYDALRDVFALIKRDFTGKRIGYPRIGAGLAGGDWDIIKAIISDKLDGEDHTLVEYQP